MMLFKLFRTDSHKIRDLQPHPNESYLDTNDYSQYCKNRCSSIKANENEECNSPQFQMYSRKSYSGRNSVTPVDISGKLSTNSFTKKTRRKRNSEKKISKELLDNQLQNSDKNCQSKPLSLTDIGVNCYLNSAFLAISSCIKYVEDMKALRLKYKTGLEKLSIFNELIEIVNGHSTSRIKISSNRIFKKWNKLCQQDSFEILEHVINQVYNEIRKYRIETGDISIKFIQEWLKVNLPMRIVLEYRIFCKCGNPLQVFLQSDLAIHVPIPLNNKEEMNAQTLIDQFFSKDSIEEYDCIREGCTENEAIRFTRLRQPLPHTICVHFQRIYWNGFQMEKIKNKLNFSVEMIIKSNFFVKDVREGNNLEKTETDDRGMDYAISERQKKRNANQNMKKGNNGMEDIMPEKSLNFISSCKTHEDQSFKLISVLVHHGSIYGGQYDCYRYVNGTWFLINEYQSVQVEEIEVLNCEAQVLFYEKNDNDVDGFV